MAKVSSVERNMKRQRLVAQYAAKRALLKDIARNKDLPVEDRFAAQLKLAALPRTRAVARAQSLPGHGPSARLLPQMKMSRIALRELGSQGLIPGLTKSSW